MVYKMSKKEIAYAVLTIFLSAIVSISVYHLWGADWRVPISGYRSDSLGVLLELKNYVRGGSVHQYIIYGNQNITEYSGNFGDSSIPMPLLKIIWMLTGSVEASVNIHAVLNSVFLALSMFWVCTRLGIRNCFSVLSGVLYGNLSYFILGANTVLLIYGTCFYIPLFCYILISLMCTEGGRNKLTTGNMMFVMGVMLYLGMNSAYYAFLAMILLAFTTLYVLFAVKNVDNILLCFVSFIAIGLGIASYTVPKILKGMGFSQLVRNMGYMMQAVIIVFSIIVLWGIAAFLKKAEKFLTLKRVYAGTFILAGIAGVAYVVLWKYTDYIGSFAGRSLVDVQLGSLKAGAMVLPAVNSAFGLGRALLGAITDIDNMQASDIAEIGVLAGAGFVYSLINIFLFEKKEIKDEILKICGLINGFIVVVAAKGGLSLLIGAFVTSGIRGYSRMCVYIAVFGLISFAILAEKISYRIKTVPAVFARNSLYVIASIILTAGVIMSVPTHYIYKDMFGFADYTQRKSEYDEWYRYIGAVETQLPEGSTVLELPLHVDDVHMGKLMTKGRAYELNIPAVISNTLYWDSLGSETMDKYLMNILDQGGSMEDFLVYVYASGYQGIYIDTMMYHDNSYAQMIEALTKQLGEPLICSENRRYFYSLADYGHSLHEKYTDEELQGIKEQISMQY